MSKKINKNYLGEYLTEIQNDICYVNATERPFSHPYHDLDEPGIYVDITNAEPLFLSIHKFESHCGWPSFTQPINENILEYYDDDSLFSRRIEVRTKQSDIHLGHVFGDGPVNSGGRRFCINGATLDFIQYDDLGEKYSQYKKYFE